MTIRLPVVIAWMVLMLRDVWSRDGFDHGMRVGLSILGMLIGGLLFFVMLRPAIAGYGFVKIPRYVKEYAVRAGEYQWIGPIRLGDREHILVRARKPAMHVSGKRADAAVAKPEELEKQRLLFQLHKSAVKPRDLHEFTGDIAVLKPSVDVDYSVVAYAREGPGDYMVGFRWDSRSDAVFMFKLRMPVAFALHVPRPRRCS